MSEVDSDDYSTDDGRKRKAEIIEEMFGRNKKTHRTPTKYQSGEDGKLDQILLMIKEMSITQKEMKGEQKEIKTEIMEIKDQQNRLNEALLKLTIENEELKKENQEIKRENAEIRKDLQETKHLIEVMEKERRKNKIVINGLKIGTTDPTDAREEIKEFFNNHLQKEITPKTVNKIGNKTCVIELANETDKKEIMANKFKLKNLKNEKIFINDDMTKHEREKMKQLRHFAKNERDRKKENWKKQLQKTKK